MKGTEARDMQRAEKGAALDASSHRTHSEA